MKNLNRAFAMALRYKWSLAISFACSALVALMWGANLGAVYPFVEVVLHDKTIHDWAAEQISEAEQSKKRILSELDELDGQLLLDEEERLRKKRMLESELEPIEGRLASIQQLLPWIQKYAPDDPYKTLVWLIVLLFLGTLLRGVALMGNMVCVARVGQRTILDIQNRVFGNVLSMDTSELDVEGTGDLVGRIRGETNTVGRAINTLFGKTVREPMKMLVCLVGAGLVNWRLLLFSMLVCPLAGFLMVQLARLTKTANRRAMEESAKLLTRLYQAVTYQRLVKAFTMEAEERKRFKVVARDVYRKAMRIAFYGAAARMNNELLGVGMISVSVLVGGYLVLSGQTTLIGIPMADEVMTFGQVMLFFAFLIGIADPIRKMGDVYNLLQAGVVAADRVFPLIDKTPAILSPANPAEIPPGPLGVESRDVVFAYEEGTPILKGLSCNIPAGSSLAIIGHNGCGKSTFINLVPRFLDVDQGSIRIGGNDIRDYRVEDLRSNVGYVTQMTMLFNDTIGENISYGSPLATAAEIREAARKAHALEFIEALEDGFDTHIGEHGGRLSGGQRQRLSLARAILKDPRILILDEATSQIDPESEALIHETLAEFIRDRTTIIVTHRMSTLDLVDQILVMKDGQAVDCGTHEQLLARCPDYQRLRQLDFEEAA